MQDNHITLDGISTACTEIQQALNHQLHTTTNPDYRSAIEKDLVMLNNLQHIVIAVKNDIDSHKVGASTELLLRIAANDFKNKLIMIPDKKAKCREIMHYLEAIHKNILGIMNAG